MRTGTTPLGNELAVTAAKVCRPQFEQRVREACAADLRRREQAAAAHGQHGGNSGSGGGESGGGGGGVGGSTTGQHTLQSVLGTAVTPNVMQALVDGMWSLDGLLVAYKHAKDMETFIRANLGNLQIQRGQQVAIYAALGRLAAGGQGPPASTAGTTGSVGGGTGSGSGLGSTSLGFGPGAAGGFMPMVPAGPPGGGAGGGGGGGAGLGTVDGGGGGAWLAPSSALGLSGSGGSGPILQPKPLPVAWTQFTTALHTAQV